VRVFHPTVLSIAALALPLVIVCTLLVGAGPAKGASGDYIVVLREGVSLSAHLKTMRITPNRVYTSAATGYQAILSDTQYKRVLASPDTVIVTANAVVATVPTVQAPPADPEQPPQVPSNGVRRIGGLLSPTAAIDGVDTRVDVDVAVVDTSVDATHPDLNVAGAANCVPGTSKFDTMGHGTMVAGFIGALDNEIGRVGVAPGARIWSVGVLSPNDKHKDKIRTADVLCAIDWVTAHPATIEVANMSLVGELPSNWERDNCGLAPRKQDSDPVHAAICASVEAGVTWVVAAGNDADDAAGWAPAGYDEVISVSGIGDSDGLPGGFGPDVGLCLDDPALLRPDDTFAFFSNYGADVDLAAPAVCISSTYPGGLYAVSTGTSFASPLVAGAAALYISTHPGATPAQVRAALVAAAEPGPIAGDPDAYPEGVVNVSGF
jgi:subtilisin family serine protease